MFTYETRHHNVEWTEHAMFSLTFAYYLSQQEDLTFFVLNHKNLRSAQRSHCIYILHLNNTPEQSHI